MAEKKNNNVAALAKMLGNLGVTSSGQTTRKVGSTVRGKNPFASEAAVAATAPQNSSSAQVSSASAAPASAAAAASSSAPLNSSDPYNFDYRLQIPIYMKYTSLMRVPKFGEPRKDELMRFEQGIPQEQGRLDPIAWGAIRILSQIPHAWLHDISNPEQTHTNYLINRAAYNKIITTDPLVVNFIRTYGNIYGHNFSLIPVKPIEKAVARKLGENKRAVTASLHGGKRNNKRRRTRKYRR